MSNERNVVFELMKEYRIRVSGMNNPVIAHIWKEIGEEDLYTFSFSHHYLPGKGAIEYAPEYIGRKDYLQAEIITLQHLENFTIEFGEPEINNHFV